MTCVYTEGFESVLDDTDAIRRGWLSPSAITVGGTNVLGLASRTGQPGRGLMLRGPYASSTGLPCSAGAVSDFGMVNTGKSIYSLWQAGGFVAGFNATFNKGTAMQVAPNQASQLVYDGVKYYWAVLIVGAAYTVGYSTDLVNWTPCPNAPPSMGMNATIAIAGSGKTTTLLVSWHNSVTAYTNYYSTDQGYTWNAMGSVGANTRGVTLTPGANVAAIGMPFISGTGFRIGYYSTLSSAPVTLAAPTVFANSTYANGFCKVVAGVAVAVGAAPTASAYNPQAGTTYLASCLMNADLTLPANWSVGPTLALGELNDLTFFKNQWLAVGYGGIYAAPNGATAPAVAGPSSASSWTRMLSTGTVAVWAVSCNSNVCVAVGQDPVNTTQAAIWISSDGVVWTKQNRFIFNSAVVQNGNCFTNVFWDGHQFVITGGMNNNVLATSSDGIAWTPLYYPDYTEAGGASVGSMLGVYSGTQNAAGVFTPYTTAAGTAVGVGLFSAAASVAGTRVVTPATVSGSSVFGQVTAVAATVPTTPLSHYFEVIATATGTVNQFAFQWALDGVVQGPISAAAQFASVSDTTGAALLLLNLPRTGNWTVIDDIYVNTLNGTNNVGQLGVVSVFPWTPSSDVAGNQLTPSSVGLSHASQVAGPFSLSQNSVSTFTTGAKDVYNARATIPANFTIKAVQADAFFTKKGYVGGNGSVGIVSQTKEVDSAAVAALVTGTPVYASVIAETDPSTNSAWLATALNAAGIAVTKTN
jgi:hypothetical protein